jgi:hypothetical protein
MKKIQNGSLDIPKLYEKIIKEIYNEKIGLKTEKITIKFKKYKNCFQGKKNY